MDAVITLALIGSPSSGRSGQQRPPVAGGRFAKLNLRETALLEHIVAVMERTGKPIVSVPLCPVQRSVFLGLGRYAPVLLPSPAAAVSALAKAVWYATHPLRGRPASAQTVSPSPSAQDG